MIHPGMATTLGFVMTDASASPAWLPDSNRMVITIRPDEIPHLALNFRQQFRADIVNQFLAHTVDSLFLHRLNQSFHDHQLTYNDS